VVRRQPGRASEQYEILHTRDFNPNSRDFVLFRQQVLRERLGWYLAELCHQFYTQLSSQTTAPEVLLPAVAEEAVAAPAPVAAPLPRCRHCLTVYDPAYGDPAQGIAAGTPWAGIVGYQCSVCEAPAADFEWWNEPLAAIGSDLRVAS
jgi:rubredoxin